jgi:hypothetical protein
MEYKWNLNSNQWENYFKEDYKYDKNNNLIINSQFQWNTATNIWDKYGEHNFIFDSQNLNTIEYQYTWNPNNNQMENTFKWEYNYDNDANMYMNIKYAWNKTSGQWENTDKTSFSYDNSYAITEIWGYNSSSRFKHKVTGSVSQKFTSGNWVSNLKSTFYYSGPFATNTEELSFRKEMLIYPNPCSGKLFLQAENQKITTVKVYNIEGKMLLQKDVNSSENNLGLELNNFVSGVYFISALLEDGSILCSKFFLEE